MWSGGCRQPITIDQLKQLRVYVADNHNQIFDVHGVKCIIDFTEGTITPLARRFGIGSVRTRF